MYIVLLHDYTLRAMCIYTNFTDTMFILSFSISVIHICRSALSSMSMVEFLKLQDLLLWGSSHRLVSRNTATSNPQTSYTLMKM